MNIDTLDLSEDIKNLCLPLISFPDKITVSKTSEDKRTQSYLISCEDTDLGKLIGRHGSISNSLRALANISPKAQRKKISLKFECNSRRK